MGNSNSGCKGLPELQVVAQCDVNQFMGTWFVIGVKPTMFETTCSNAVEKYTFVGSSDQHGKKSKHDIDIDFQYNDKEPITSKLKKLPQKGYIVGEGEKRLMSGRWQVSPIWPIKAPYLIVELDEKYSYTVIGYPSRQYAWIMSRTPTMSDELYEDLCQRLVKKHQYSLDGMRKVPQVWTSEEREKRGLSKDEIPDDYLVASSTTKE